MKYLIVAVALANAVAGFSAADAADGCAPGWYRGPDGGCRPRGAVAVRPRGCPHGFFWASGRCHPIR
ncbi:hypothetical protein Q2941_32290 [Bradyrhizobium sp. UFLA05-153]